MPDPMDELSWQTDCFFLYGKKTVINRSHVCVNFRVVVPAIGLGPSINVLVETSMAGASFVALARHSVPPAIAASRRLTMFAILLACSSLLVVIPCGATTTQMTKPVLEDIGRSEISSIPRNPKLAMATTEAQTQHPSHDLRRRESVFTGETMVAGNLSVIDTIGSICGYVTSDIRKSVAECTSHIY